MRKLGSWKGQTYGIDILSRLATYGVGTSAPAIRSIGASKYSNKCFFQSVNHTLNLY